MAIVPKIKAIAANGIVHIAGAFVVMGCWAMFANRHHPLPAMLFPGVVQGALSATITWIMKTALDRISAFCFRRGKPWQALLAPPMVAGSVSLAGLVIGHTLADTPELIATIAVPFSLAFTYAWAYSYGLWNKRRSPV